MDLWVLAAGWIWRPKTARMEGRRSLSARARDQEERVEVAREGREVAAGAPDTWQRGNYTGETDKKGKRKKEARRPSPPPSWRRGPAS